MPDPRWTAETVEIFARAYWDSSPFMGSFRPWDEMDGPGVDVMRAAVAAGLTALADAGLLLPPGTTTQEERGTRIGSGEIVTTAEARGRYTISAQSLRTRTVYTAPWREVSDDH